MSEKTPKILTPGPTGTQTPEPTDRPLSKYELLCRTPSMKMEKGDLKVWTEFSVVIGKVSAAAAALERLRTRVPSMKDNRSCRTCADNLKETSIVMMKEFHSLRNGRAAKKYDATHVCAECHMVFMVPLPEDGICDACRGAKAPRLGPY